MVDLRRIVNRQKKEDNDLRERRNIKRGTVGLPGKHIVIIVIAVLLLAAIIGMAIYRSIAKYTDFRTVKSLDIDDGVGSQYIPFEDFSLSMD